MEERATEGYLLLADISGYTAFLGETELEHAHGIVRELTALIRRELVPPLRFVKREGDAVFCYADGAVFRDGERLIETIEACYFAFSNRIDDIERSTTCDCLACKSVGSLDLKFLAHFGAFVVDDDDGHEDLTGRDVILVHRLLKNTIDGSAYAFFTAACLRRLPPGFAPAPHVENCDSLGTTAGGVHALRPVLAEMRSSRREHVTVADADFGAVAVVPTVPALAWQYLVDARERQRWVCTAFSDEPDVATPNERGRAGVGASSHCSHGPGTWFREFLDWTPFQSYTCRTVAPGSAPVDARSVIETFEFRPVDGGTQVSRRMRLVDRSPAAVDAFLELTPLLEAGWRRSFDALRLVIEEDGAGRSP